MDEADSTQIRIEKPVFSDLAEHATFKAYSTFGHFCYHLTNLNGCFCFLAQTWMSRTTGLGASVDEDMGSLRGGNI